MIVDMVRIFLPTEPWSLVASATTCSVLATAVTSRHSAGVRTKGCRVSATWTAVPFAVSPRPFRRTAASWSAKPHPSATSAVRPFAGPQRLACKDWDSLRTAFSRLPETFRATAASSWVMDMVCRLIPAFRWTPETGMEHLGFQIAEAVAGDGRTVVGSRHGASGWSAAVIWNAEGGVRDLREFLINEHGLADALAGWKLTSALDISSDGRTIAGLGENPLGHVEAWVFTTDVQPLVGDYNGDAIVDASDYVVWRGTLGQTGAGLAADGNGNGEIDTGDYDVWRLLFGEMIAQSSDVIGPANGSSAVPEPDASLLLAVALIAAAGTTRRGLRFATKFSHATCTQAMMALPTAWRTCC